MLSQARVFEVSNYMYYCIFFTVLFKEKRLISKLLNLIKRSSKWHNRRFKAAEFNRQLQRNIVLQFGTNL